MIKTEEELIWESYLSYHIQGRGDEVDFPLIVEGLIASAPLSKAKYIMQRNFSIIDEVSGVDSEDNGILRVNIVKKLNEKSLNYILKMGDMLGYYPAGYGNNFEYHKFDKDVILNIEDGLKYQIYFEAKYDKIVSINKDLYHVTTKKKLDKIQKIGLTPKSMSKISEHPDRIYLAINKNGADFIKNQLEQYNESELIVLKIDITKLQNHKFMKDPNYNVGVYTYQNIPPNAIEVVDDYEEYSDVLKNFRKKI